MRPFGTAPYKFKLCTVHEKPPRTPERIPSSSWSGVPSFFFLLGHFDLPGSESTALPEFKQCCGSGCGIRCLSDPWIRDPGRVKNNDPDPGWTSLVPWVRWRRPRRSRITPPHLLSWPCVSDLLRSKRPRAGYALQPSMTRKPQLQ